MKTYLSFGGGVNSTAMLLMAEYDEAVFVDTGCEMPETYEYLKMLLKNGYQIQIIKPKIQGFDNLYEYAMRYRIVPTTQFRWCTDKFKIRPIHAYVEKPCFMLIGFDYGEQKRARLSNDNGIENRYPLIEAEIDRDACKQLIKDYGLPLPVKSGCYICPYQTIQQWRRLRMSHPDLWCKVLDLEKKNMEYRESIGKKPLYLYSNMKPLDLVVNESQGELFQEYKPPCYCAR